MGSKVYRLDITELLSETLPVCQGDNVIVIETKLLSKHAQLRSRSYKQDLPFGVKEKRIHDNISQTHEPIIGVKYDATLTQKLIGFVMKTVLYNRAGLEVRGSLTPKFLLLKVIDLHTTIDSIL